MNKTDRLVEWVERTGCVLESQIVGSGMSHALNDALLAGRVDMAAHPTVRDSSGAPAAAVVPRKSAQADAPEGER
jgi:hypothetical protein